MRYTVGHAYHGILLAVSGTTYGDTRFHGYIAKASGCVREARLEGLLTVIPHRIAGIENAPGVAGCWGSGKD